MNVSDMANARNRSLEVTIISGEDLRINGRPIKNNAFVTVKADSRCPSSSHESTKPDARGDSYPYWDEKLHVELPAGSPYIVVEVCRRSSSAGDKLVGAAWIPVSDFVGGYAPENYLHFLSYRLRDAEGLRNGIINISLRVVASSHKGASSCSSPSPPPALAFRMPVDRENHGGTVTGVPIWCPNQWKSERDVF